MESYIKNQRNKNPIYVTQPSLPPLEEYVALLESVWDTGILTHNGPLVQRFEKDVSKKLGLNDFVAVTNGTIAIQMAIKSLELKGEIITTAFSWIATISAIKWEGCKPVLCDIDPNTLNIDCNKIEDLITEDTVAIMPVHVFGNPCNVLEIERIATKHGLKVIYDAAHAIGSTFEGVSVLDFGDISATSLHGTKLLNTAEGGGCIAKHAEINEKLRRIRFFGHNSSKEIVEDGFNGKMTEVHAALGIANLKYFDEVLADRRKKYLTYYNFLKSNVRIRFQMLNGEGCNYSYFPIIFESEKMLLSVEIRLNQKKVYPRRYFYPSLNTLSNVVQHQNTPISEDVSRRILCLPLYKNLTLEEIAMISDLINIENSL